MPVAFDLEPHARSERIHFGERWISELRQPGEDVPANFEDEVAHPPSNRAATRVAV